MVSSAFPVAEDTLRARLERALVARGIEEPRFPDDVARSLDERARHSEARFVLGRYLLIVEIGHGGMGVVHEAWDPSIGRRVAIKTLEPDRLPDDEREETIERFRRETRIMAGLRHPAVPTIFDFGRAEPTDPITGRSHPTTLFSVMEFLEGEPLSDRIAREGKLEDAAAVAIAIQIAEGLEVAHRAGVVHRDIKPSNIFLEQSARVVLLDFGIAKTGDLALTKHMQILGTPSYVAPERLTTGTIDGRADLFSLGVLLYVMVEGQTPFASQEAYRVIDEIAKGQHRTLVRTDPAGHALSELVEALMATRPEDRPASAREVARDLRRILRDLRASVAASDHERRIESSTSHPPTDPVSRALVAQDDEATGPMTLSSSDEDASARVPVPELVGTKPDFSLIARASRLAAMPASDHGEIDGDTDSDGIALVLRQKANIRKEWASSESEETPSDHTVADARTAQSGSLVSEDAHVESETTGTDPTVARVGAPSRPRVSSTRARVATERIHRVAHRGAVGVPTPPSGEAGARITPADGSRAASAAVARKTFGAATSSPIAQAGPRSGLLGMGRDGARSAVPTRAAIVVVGLLASIALGLWLGRMRRTDVVSDTSAIDAARPVVYSTRTPEPELAAPPSREPELVRPELGRALPRESDAAREQAKGGSPNDRRRGSDAPGLGVEKAVDACREIVEKNVAEPRVDVKLQRLAVFAAGHPGEACVHWHLGNLQDREGDRIAARRSYERFLELAPDDPRRAAVARRIRDLVAEPGPR